MRSPAFALCCAALVAAAAAPCAAADVYRCNEGGRIVYSDRPCGADAKAVGIAPDENASVHGRLKPGTTVQPSAAVVDACWNGFRKLARDPTAAQFVGQTASASEDGFPWLTIEADFADKYGAVNRKSVRCRLNYDLSINRAVTDAEHAQFFQSESDGAPKKAK